MSHDLRLYNLHPSPNNMKARLALRVKNLEYETTQVEFEDRAEVVQVSGQPLTPVLVHEGHVIWDSHAIVRYVDSAFREGTRLFSEDYAEIKEIESWEWFARTEISSPVAMVLGQFFAEKPDPGVFEEACGLMHERTAPLEEQLQKTEWLTGDRITAADVFCAPWVWYASVPDDVDEATNPLAPFFGKHLRLGDGRDACRNWAAKVMEFDR
jgi:glutathione S-transferase